MSLLIITLILRHIDFKSSNRGILVDHDILWTMTDEVEWKDLYWKKDVMNVLPDQVS